MDEKTKQYVAYVLERNSSGRNFPYEIGMVCDLLDGEKAKGHFVVDERKCNPLGIAHGGTYFTLMDQLAGMLVAANGRIGVTIQCSTNFLRAAKAGDTVWCEAKVVHMGRSTGLVEARCYDDRDRTLASAAVQFFLNGFLEDTME